MKKPDPQTPDLSGDKRVVVNDQGEVLGEREFVPGHMPLSGIDFKGTTKDGFAIWPLFYVFALTNKGGCKRGQRYRVIGVTMTGGLMLQGVSGFHHMPDFVQAFDTGVAPEAANENKA